MHDVYKDEATSEWFFPDNSYILSETDEKGLILYANDLFCKIAGSSINDLLGEPHNIVRHPDMPRVAFQGLWDDIESKGFWSGYVKNMSKDRGFYWVYATVMRLKASSGKISYLSVRTKPSREDVEKYSKLYAEIKAGEQ